MVKLSFKSTELAKNFDRSEDSLFKGFQLLKEEIVLGEKKEEHNVEIDDLVDLDEND